MQLFDTHAHVGLITEDPIEQLIVIQEAIQEDVVGIVSICNSLRDFYQIYQNLKSENHIYHSIGISPSEVSHPGDDWEAKISEGTKRERVLAIGAIGLDYYHKIGDRVCTLGPRRVFPNLKVAAVGFKPADNFVAGNSLG